MGTAWFFALMIIVCAEVIARELFSLPMRGVTEITAFSLVGATFLQLANAFHADRITRADFLITGIKKNFGAGYYVLECLISLAGMLAMCLVVRSAWPKLIRSFSENELVGIPGEFSFPVWPLRVLVVAGAVMAATVLLNRSLSGVGEIRKKYQTQGLLTLVFSIIVLISAWLISFPVLMDAGFTNFAIGAAALVVLVLLVMLGVHVGNAMILVGFVALWLIKGRIALPQTMLGISATEHLANYYFSAVPLFVLMGLLVAASDIGRETFLAARWITQPIRAGLGIATVGANAVFAAVTGSSIASATVFSRIATPEMIRHGYTKRFAVGVVAGSSVLGMLIPPSLLLIIYGFLAEQSVGHLFIAAIIPGLLLAVAMCLMIWLRAKYQPDAIFEKNFTVSDHDSLDAMHVGRAALLLIPVLGLLVLVLGGIYGGFFTPTEAGAVGSAGALLFGLASRRLNPASLWKVMVETGQIATAVLFLIMAANVFTVMLASSGFVQSIGTMMNSLGLDLWQFALLYALLLVILGMFLESVSIMLIMVPIALPTAVLLGGDPIWFGILTVIAVEIGLLTPPFGLTCFVVSSSLREQGISLSDIFIGALPFVGVMALVTIILVLVPSLGSFVP